MKARLAKKIYRMFGQPWGISLPGNYQIKELRRIHNRVHRHIDAKLEMPFWIYDERTGYPKLSTYSEQAWFLYWCGKRFIKRTQLPDGGFISSICIGIDHDISFSPLKRMPVIFECMWFKGVNGEADMSGEHQERAATRGEILKIHDDMVGKALKELKVA